VSQHLKKIIIQNFQSHKESSLDFHPGINAIVGITGSGKSSIMRAFRLVWENRPSDETKYRSWWGGETKVNLIHADGHTVERIRGKENLYIVDGKRNAAFRTDVPESAKKILNISYVNYQWQKEQFFMLGDNPPELARKLNAAINLEDIGITISNINSMVRDNNRDIDSVGSAITENITKYNSFIGLADANRKLTELEQDEETIAELQKQKDRLADLINSYNSITILDIPKKFNLHLENLITLNNTIDSISSDKERLRILILKYKSFTETYESAVKKASSIDSIIKKEMPEVCPLCKTRLKK